MCWKRENTPLWDDKQENTCGFCQHANILASGEQVICQKRKNLYDISHTCRKFRFDILKKDVRRPKKPDFSRFSEKNFEL